MTTLHHLFGFSFLLMVIFSNKTAGSFDLQGMECGKVASTDDVFTLKVRNGKDISAEDAPWNVAINNGAGKSGGPFHVDCGGTLVSPRHVLTASHCLWINHGSQDVKRACNYEQRKTAYASTTSEECSRSSCPAACHRVEAENIKVMIGSNDINSNRKQIFSVSNMTLHPDWMNQLEWKHAVVKGKDIAVLELSEEVTFSDKIQPICLPKAAHQLVKPGHVVRVTGFGFKGGYNVAEILQGADLTIRPTETCQRKYAKYGYELKDQICALGENKTDTCRGDSGGGLTAKDDQDRATLVGIVSFGQQQCGERDISGVYTNVANNLEWITNIIQFSQKSSHLPPLPPTPISSCTCNGFITPEGRGECRTRFDGKPFCYIQPEANCDDALESSQYPGKKWSFSACPERVILCPKHQFQCHSDNKCVHRLFVCDEQNDCKDGSDEQYC